MKYIVIGYGFLGSEISSYLSLNNKVIILSKSIKTFKKKNIEIIDYNNFKKNDFNKIFDQGDVIIFSAHPNKDSKLENKKFSKLFELIILCAKLNKVSQFLFLSSIKLYRKNKKLNESSPIHAYSNYTKLKLQCENKIHQLSNKTEMYFKIIRVSNVFGIPKNYKINFDNLLIPNMIIQSLKTKKIFLKNPNMYKDFIVIEDFLNKFLLILNYNKKLSSVNTFNLGSYKSLSLDHVASLISTMQKKNKILIKKNTHDDTNKKFKFYSQFSFLKKTYDNNKLKKRIRELVLFYEKKNY